MLDDVLILAAPVVVFALLALLVWWDGRRWEARCKAPAPRVPVILFPGGMPRLFPPTDARTGRAARRARHGGAR